MNRQTGIPLQSEEGLVTVASLLCEAAHQLCIIVSWYRGSVH